MLKYVSKFFLEILPSVIATVVGAYIVNHYIVTKPGNDAPVAAAVSTVDPKKTEAATAKADTKTPDAPSDVANAPDTSASKSKAGADRAADKAADKASDTASLPLDNRRHKPVPREKAVAKVEPKIEQKTEPAVAQTPVPVVAPMTASIAPPETVSPADDKRDVNDLARAAIERLRTSKEMAKETPRAQDALADPPRQEAVRVVAPPSIQPLPPAIMVSTPNSEAFDQRTGSVSASRPPYAAEARSDNARRLVPPADIPTPPMDIHADATDSPSGRTSVADDMMSAAKSVFHAVIPH